MAAEKLLALLPGPDSSSPTWSDCTEKVGPENIEVPTLNCIPVVFRNVVDWLLILAGVVAVFLIVYSGYKYITSGGDPKQADEARKTLTYAIIGLLVVFFSFFIINFLSGITNIECLKTFGFDC